MERLWRPDGLTTTDLTIIRNQFKSGPTAIAVRADRAEELWLKDSRFEDITGPALIISDENNARTEINLENVVCSRVPVLARFRESGEEIAGTGAVYQVRSFTHGLHIGDLGGLPEIKTTFDATDLASLPPPGSVGYSRPASVRHVVQPQVSWRQR